MEVKVFKDIRRWVASTACIKEKEVSHWIKLNQSKTSIRIPKFLKISPCKWKSFLYINRKTLRMSKGSSIKYLRKIFRKTNISNPLIRTESLGIKGRWPFAEKLGFLSLSYILSWSIKRIWFKERFTTNKIRKTTYYIRISIKLTCRALRNSKLPSACTFNNVALSLTWKTMR